MGNFDVKVVTQMSIGGASKSLDHLSKEMDDLAREMPAAAARAINASLTGTKTEIKRIVRVEYNLKASSIDSRITAVKAHRAKITGHIESKGQMLNLTDIDARQTAKGVTVNVKKSTGRKLIPRAFIQPGRNSGKLIVLRRPGNPRGQHERLYGRYGPQGSGQKVGSKSTLDAFYGPHPEVLYNQPQIWAKISTAASQRLEKNIAKEIDAELRKLDGKW